MFNLSSTAVTFTFHQALETAVRHGVVWCEGQTSAKVAAQAGELPAPCLCGAVCRSAVWQRGYPCEGYADSVVQQAFAVARVVNSNTPQRAGRRRRSQ